MEVKKLGYWSSTAAAIFGFFFTAALIMSLPGSIPAPWDTFWQVLPSLFLAWSYMLMLLCLYRAAPSEKNIGALAGAAFSIIYAGINTAVYFTVLVVVIPGIISGKTGEIELLLFEPGKFLFALNGIAYTLMSIAALFSSTAFIPGSFLRRAMTAHGLLAPLICGAVLWGPIKYAGALWIITFPFMGIASVLYFKHLQIDVDGQTPLPAAQAK